MPVVCIEKELDGVMILTLKGKLIATGDAEKLHMFISSVLEPQYKSDYSEYEKYNQNFPAWVSGQSCGL